MKRQTHLATVFSVMILAGILVLNDACAETAAQQTALEKKLYQAAKAEGKLLYWDSLPLKEAAIFIKAFNERYPGIEIVFWEASNDTSENKYFAERQAGKTSVDVISIESYDKYKKEGLLTDLSDIIKDTDFPRVFCPQSLDAVATEHSIKGAAYNTKLISPKEAPRSWEDLLDPRWKGKIAVEIGLDPFVLLTKTWGEEKIHNYLKKLREQNPIFQKGSTNAMTLLGAGEYGIAINVLLHRTLDMIDKGTPVAWLPVNPVADYINPLSAVKDAPHPNAAKLYLRWLMTSEGRGMVEKIRKKGSPLPGTGTRQSRELEKLGVKVVVVPSWEVDFRGIQANYQKIVGFSK